MLSASQSINQGFCFRDFIVSSISCLLQGSGGKALQVFSHLVFLNGVQCNSFVVWWVTEGMLSDVCTHSYWERLPGRWVWSQKGQSGRIRLCLPFTKLICIKGPSQEGDSTLSKICWKETEKVIPFKMLHCCFGISYHDLAEPHRQSIMLSTFIRSCHT